MARSLFGGSSDDYAVDSNGRPVAGRRVRFYTSAAMSTEITDLASDAAGTGTPLTVTTDTHGYWGPVYGPDAVTVMYAGTVDAAGNPPAYVVAVYTHTQTGGGAGVASFNTRIGAVTLSKADVTSTGLAAADVGADTSGAAATVQTNLTAEVTRAQAAEAALGGGMQFRTAVVVASTNQALTGLPTVDGVTLTAGQVILLTGQSSGSQNGLWAVAAGAWARPANFAAGADATATSVLVESGTAGAGTTYAVTGTTNNVVGTNVLTFVKTSGSAAFVGIGKLVANAADYHATNRTEVEINAAVAAVKAAGGGRVLVRAADGPWTISRHVNGDLASGGVLIDAPNITIESDGATLNLADNCDFFKIRSTLGTQVTITADIAATDSNIAVTSSASFTVGQWVFLRLGQAAYDAGEPDFWLYAKVQSIPDGTHVTLDRVVGYALSVAGVASASQKSIAPVTTMVENVAIAGQWNLVNPATGSANAEGGINVQYARRVTVGDVTATTPGTGVILAQFVDGLNAGNLRVPSSHVQAAHTAKGRALTLSECRGVSIAVLAAEDFEKVPVMMEGRCEGVELGNLLLANTYSSRVNASTALISTVGNSRGVIGALHCTGAGSYVWDTGASTGNDFRIRGAFFYTSTRPIISDLGIVRERLYVDSTLFSKIRTARVRIPLGLNMSAVTYPLPSGHAREVRVYATTTTGVTGLYFGSTGSNTGDQHASLVAGQTVALPVTGLGSIYPLSADTGKKVIVYTDGTVPNAATNHFLIVEMDYIADPTAGTDASLDKLYAVDGYQLLTAASGSWTVPQGVSRVRVRAVGAGGGGGGGGANTTLGATQAGGAGGGSGMVLDQVFSVTPGASVTYTVGAGGGGGNGGAAGGVNNGASGSNGTASTFTIGGTTYTAPPGAAGQGGTANNAGTKNGGAYGAAAAAPTGGAIPGCGAQSAGTASPSPFGTWGGGGGGAASASLGGSGGGAATATGQASVAGGGTGGSGTINGTAGTTATMAGCGGGGGGGAFTSGAGGNGGSGASGQIEIFYIA